jgi:7-cyano-7-deazaguanine synthase in queuosine biosynthesis
MFSGGLDSTYLAWMMTKETTDRIHLHHILLKDPAQRWPHELEACQKVVDRLQAMRFVEYTTTEYDPMGPPMGFDTDLAAFCGARQAFRTIGNVRVCIGTCMDDLTAPYNKERYHRKIIHKMFKFAVRSNACLYGSKDVNVDETLYFPLLELGIDKDHMVKNLPKSLLKDAWSCRQPIGKKKCNQCESCLARQQS